MGAVVFAASLFCDYAWFVTQRAMPGPAGAYWDRRAAECRQDNSYTMMLQGERLWVFTGKPCGLECRRTKTSHVVGRRVAVDSWVLSADAWRFRQTEFSCGDGTSRTNELVRSSDFAKHDWCVSSDPKGCP